MSVFEVELTQTEVMELQKLALMPGWPVITKLLKAIDAGATAQAMACKVPNKETKLTLLEEAQAVQRIVEKLIYLLNSYSAIALQPEAQADVPELFQNIWEERKAN